MAALPVLVLVNGAPASGKSTLALRLAEALPLPLVSRDAIKAGLADTVGPDDLSALATLGEASFRLFYDTLARFLAARVGVVAEQAFFRGRAEQELLPLIERSRAVVLHCATPEHTDRLRARWASGARHWSYRDAEYLARIDAGTVDWTVFQPLDLAVPRLDIDTSAGYAPSFSEIVAFVRSATAPVSAASPPRN